MWVVDSNGAQGYTQLRRWFDKQGTMWFSMSTGGANPVTALRAFQLVEARQEPVRGGRGAALLWSIIASET